MAAEIGLDQPSPYRPCARDRALDGLLLRVGRGDRTAFAALYDALSQAVYAMTLRADRDAEQSAEVTEEVFLDAWRQARGFDPEQGSARDWVHALSLQQRP